MQVVLSHLQQLLKQQTPVIIPHLGAFSVITKPLSHDKTSHLFTPGAAIIGFNAFMAQSDTKLASYIAKQTGWNLEAAQSKLTEFVDRIKQATLQQQKVLLPGLGTLTSNQKSVLQFTACKDNCMAHASFGLPSISATALAPEQIKQPVIATLADITHNKNISPKKTVTLLSCMGLLALLLVALYGLLAAGYLTSTKVWIAQSMAQLSEAWFSYFNS